MTSKDPIVLFTPYFAAKTPERQAELDECVRRNLACDQISRLILLVDDGHEPQILHDKLEVIKIDKRPTYQQWVDLSKELGQACFSILANSDIYFGETISNIRLLLSAPESFVALSRYEMIAETLEPHPNPHWSQDTWAFRSDSNLPDSLYKMLDIPLGVPRCDNKVAYIFAIHGWKIFNPIKHLRSVHLHETMQRNYDKKTDCTVIGGVAYVYPGIKIDDAAMIEIDIWALGTQAIRKVGLNKSLDAWVKEARKTSSADQQTNSLPGLPTFESSSAPPSYNRIDNSETSPAVSMRDFLTNGKILYDHLRRFRIYRLQDQLLCLDGLYPNKPKYLPVGVIKTPLINLGLDLLALWIPPIVDTAPISIEDRPSAPDDCHFWQYPCATEKQAFENHLSIKLGANIDTERRVIHTYLPLPWASYIDKKQYPMQVVALFKPRIMGLNSLAKANGFTLAVHTVCQQIHWQRFSQHFHELGITDLHLSHYEKNIAPVHDDNYFNFHSWPLIAVNIEDSTRSSGIEIGRSILQKRYLASFIGAHMPHYRSEVRLSLLQEAKNDGGNDILVDLGGEWHFNKIVYHEQVANKDISSTEQEKHETATQRYNEILSDSVFSLCPEGAGPNTLRVWESMAVGSIPVIVSDDWIPPDIPGDITMKDCCLFVSSHEIEGLFSRLRFMPPEIITEMQVKCIKLYKEIRKMVTYTTFF